MLLRINVRLLYWSCKNVRNDNFDLPKVAISPSRELLDSTKVVCRATSTAFIFFACARAFACICAALRFFRTRAASTASDMLFARKNTVNRPNSCVDKWCVRRTVMVRVRVRVRVRVMVWVCVRVRVTDI